MGWLVDTVELAIRKLTMAIIDGYALVDARSQSVSKITASRSTMCNVSLLADHTNATSSQESLTRPTFTARRLKCSTTSFPKILIQEDMSPSESTRNTDEDQGSTYNNMKTVRKIS